jgi:hypothetical protein
VPPPSVLVTTPAHRVGARIFHRRQELAGEAVGRRGIIAAGGVIPSLHRPGSEKERDANRETAAVFPSFQRKRVRYRTVTSMRIQG